VKNIYKLIEHLVNNWQNNLSEALAPRVKQQLIDKFKQEADDYNIEVTDKQLSDYIDFFDARLKNNPKVTEKDLNKYSLQSLIKLVSSYKGSTEEEPDTADITPDVVYNENGLIIYNGSNEDNCLNFGRGEQWCITRGSFATYRYDSNRKNPTFYLVKDTNLPDRRDERKSFFVVVVGSDNTYKVSDRSNNDVGGRQTEWNRWEPWSFVEQNFPSVRGLQSVFRYIPISKSEKLSQVYKNKAITVGEWLKAPYSFKEQYLVVRKGQQLFSDINNQNFVAKVLPKLPQIAEMIAENYGYIDILVLLQEFDSFVPKYQKSIIANASRFTKVNSNIIESDVYPWSAKKAVVKGNLLQIPEDERYYITKDNNAIVKLKFDRGEVKMGIFKENENYPNIKINERTGKYLADYPELDKLPFETIVKLVSDNILPKESLDKVIEKAKTDPNSAIIIKNTDEGQMLLDSNTFKAYKYEDGKFKPIPFDDDSVQSVLTNEEGNNSFQDGVVRLLSQFDNINNVPISNIIPILNSTPYNRRTIVQDGDSYVFITVPETNNIQAWISSEPLQNNYPEKIWLDTGRFTGSTRADLESWRAFFEYLRSQNLAYNTNQLLGMFRNTYYTGERFAKANPPLTEDNLYKIVEYEGVVYLVNRTNSRESRKISPNSGKLIKASIAPNLAARMLGVEPPARPAAAAGRRGRTAGTTRQAEPTAAPAQGGGQDTIDLITQAGLTTGFDALPTGVRNRLINGSVTPVNTDRGATRRNGALGTRGRVTGVITAGQSKFYVIRLASGTMIGSVAMQPDARHYVVTTQTAFGIPNANALISALQQRNLAEEMKAPLVHLHSLASPQDLEEIKHKLKSFSNRGMLKEESTQYTVEGTLLTNTEERPQKDILSDIRSLPGITIVSSKDINPDDTAFSNPNYYTVLKIKIDPHPFPSGFKDEDLQQLFTDIRAIKGVRNFKLSKSVEKKTV
jgi:hypothetical protein